MPLTPPAAVLRELPPRLRPVVAPLVRWAFGAAVGAILGPALGLFAAYHAVIAPHADGRRGVELVGHNFMPGYEPTVLGAIAGVAWGCALGFAGGWLFAFVRNAVVWLSVHLVFWRQRAAADSRVLDDLM